jgi:SAM-dependent methyltransferase
MPAAAPRASTQRFSDRVEFYVRYRPRYPRALVEHLARTGVLPEDAVVADIGSGTGFLSEVFLCHGCTVYGVEPNAEMRAAAEALLAPYPRFHSVEGTAEATGLPERSADWAVAGQAFHWFDQDAAAAEFRRILKPGGHAGICWNERDAQASPFMLAYDELIRRHSPEYEDVGHRNIGKVIYERFFGHRRYVLDAFPNVQSFDREGLRGRLRSSSYTPPPGHPGHEPMMADLDALFDAHQQDGQVTFTYVSKIFWGELA